MNLMVVFVIEGVFLASVLIMRPLSCFFFLFLDSGQKNTVHVGAIKHGLLPWKYPWCCAGMILGNIATPYPTFGVKVSKWREFQVNTSK